MSNSAFAPIIQGNQNATKLINQLKSAQDQYPPLHKEEEEQLIKKYKNNRQKLNELLVMHNIKFVFSKAKKYMSKTRDFDGLVQEGMKGLAEAASRFDIGHGTKFITYANWWITKFMLQTFDKKKNWIDTHSTSLNSQALQATGIDSDRVTYENFINKYIEPSQDNSKSIESQLSTNEQIDICQQLMENLKNDQSLSATEKAVFTDYYYNREKTRDIAAKYKLEIPEVNRIRNTILGKLKTVLIDQYQIDSYDDLRS